MLVALGFLIAFLIAVKKGQYKDTHTPAIRVLFDNETEKKIKKKIILNPNRGVVNGIRKI